MALSNEVNDEAARTFLTARHEFQSVFGDLAKGKRNWQVVAFLALALCALFAITVMRLALTSRITPYVVEVDHLGRAVAVGPAEPLARTDRRVVIAQLATFIKNVRTVVPSMAAQRDVLQRAYALVNGRAAEFLNTYFADPTRDPRRLGQSLTRLVEVTSLLSIPSETPHTASSTETWKVQWTETVIPVAADAVSETTAWEAYLTVQLRPPTHTDGIELNPLGLTILTITWSPIGLPSARPTPSPSPQPLE